MISDYLNMKLGYEPVINRLWADMRKPPTAIYDKGFHDK